MSGKRSRRVVVPSTTAATDPVMAELGLSASADPSAPPTAATEEKTAANAAAQQSTERRRMSGWVSADVQEAARAAVWWTNNKPNGFQNMSDLIEAALIDKVQELADEYNGGEAFPPIPEGRRLKTGRPISR